MTVHRLGRSPSLPRIGDSSFFCARFPQKSAVVAAASLKPSSFAKWAFTSHCPFFFDLARGLGLNVSDSDHLWIEQISKVHG